MPMMHKIKKASSLLRNHKSSALVAILAIGVFGVAITEKTGILNGQKAATINTTLNATEPSKFTVERPGEKYVLDVRTHRKTRLGLWIEDSEGEKVYEVKCRKARRSHCIAFTAPEAGDYTVQLERSRPLFGVSANRSGSAISATIDVFTKDRRVVGPFLTSWGL